MHGLIVNQLRNYTVARHGRGGWLSVLTSSGAPLSEGPPAIDAEYDDAIVVSVVVAVAALARTDTQVLLADFGRYLADGLLRVYQPLVDSGWRTLDVIEHVEAHIHTVVRMRDPHAGPPYLTAIRRSPTAVDVIYLSERHMCALGEGIVHGLAAHFGEQVEVTQPECMLRGDARCLIAVTLTAD